jgi:hypothetical protein
MYAVSVMIVPGGQSGSKRKRRLAAALAVAAALGGGVAAAERQPEPWVKISLEKLGFPGVSQGFLNAGASALTVDFLDNTHLLVSYGLRGLVTRVPGDPVTDEDREVRAEIVELPSGKVQARTQWHLHDHGRYLWPLGQGRFLVRIGGSLSTITPLTNAQEPFRRVAFPGRGIYPSEVFASFDGGVLTVETAIPQPKPEGAATWADAQVPRNDTMLDLFRIGGDGSAGSPLVATAAKAVRSPRPLAVPMDRDGYLWTDGEERDQNLWMVTFYEFGSEAPEKRKLSLGELHSTCAPVLQLLSRSEFMALTCEGLTDRMKLATYGFDGHENWEEPLDASTSVAVATSAEAGRFAFSRITSSSAPADALSGAPGETTLRQEVRVYQSESGDLLLKVSTDPVFRTAENFDLAPDGRLAAVVRDGNIAVYALPALNERDRKDLAEVAKYAPPVGGEKALEMDAVTVQARPGEVLAGDAPQVEVPVMSQAGGPALPAPGEKTQVTTRKPPTLLLPGEKAEFKDKGQPQNRD